MDQATKEPWSRGGGGVAGTGGGGSTAGGSGANRRKCLVNAHLSFYNLNVALTLFYLITLKRFKRFQTLYRFKSLILINRKH